MQQYLDFAIALAEEAGEHLLSEFRKNPPNVRGTGKGVKSIADEVADTIIKKGIEEKYPDHSYLTEEKDLVQRNGHYTWIVDPLDGTRNYVNHNPLFSVSIALWKDGEPILGVIEAPVLKEQFTVAADGDAIVFDKLRGQKYKAQVSGVSSIENSYYIFCEGGETQKSKLVEKVAQLFPKTYDLRKLGSAALELAWVGAGRSEMYATTKISLWDIAAGILFVKKAGGKILNMEGSEYGWEDFKPGERFDIVVTNGNVEVPF